MEVNGRRVAEEAPARMHLGDFLRDRLRLTGTHLGCEHGVCGACTVLLDGAPVRSCISYAVACEGRRVTTIEGYDGDPVMRRLREAFTRHHALQCGYCTPGMLTTARDIVLRLPGADEARIRTELAGNLCRCTGYMGIVAAVMSVLGQLRESPDAEVDTLRSALAHGDGGVPAIPAPPVAFEAFEAFTAKAVAPAAGGAPMAGAQATSSAGKTNQIDGMFEVPFPAERLWAFMADLPAVAACLPGAAIEEQQGDRVKGTVSIKFGPMRAAFNGAARLDRDDAAMRAVFRGAGQDTFSRSRATGDIIYQVEDAGNGHALARVKLAYSLQGPLAQFSRSGLVQDFVRRMIADFGANVAARLAGTAHTQPLPASFNAFGMLFRVLRASIQRWFKRGS
jgi:carbon-monoxide dehydrogenase small subunit